MKKLFFGMEMKWWKVIAFAVITGVYTGIIMQIHFLDGTSFQDIGISYEWWILFAVIICMNCEKPLEAALKTFVFFLISQPLVYLTMWPEYHCFPWNYYRFWGFMTILTLPGGYTCWQVKRKNLLSALILSVACGFLALMGVGGLLSVFRVGGFPYHLLTALFCLAQAAVYIIVLQDRTRTRLITTAIALVMAVAYFAYQVNSDLSRSNYILPMEDEVLACAVEDEKIVSASPGMPGQIDIVAHRVGTTTVECEMEDGGVVVLRVTVEGNGGIYTEVLE